MQGVTNYRRSAFAAAFCLVFSAAGLVPLRAQQATLSGIVLDQAGKSIEGASILAKNDAAGTSSAATTGADGHFSVTGLAAGTYTILSSAPGFALNTRRGVTVPGTDNLSITLNVDAISQSVTRSCSQPTKLRRGTLSTPRRHAPKSPAL
jgi:hypothetical protein